MQYKAMQGKTAAPQRAQNRLVGGLQSCSMLPPPRFLPPPPHSCRADPSHGPAAHHDPRRFGRHPDAGAGGGQPDDEAGEAPLRGQHPLWHHRGIGGERCVWGGGEGFKGRGRRQSPPPQFVLSRGGGEGGAADAAAHGGAAAARPHRASAPNPLLPPCPSSTPPPFPPFSVSYGCGVPAAPPPPSPFTSPLPQIQLRSSWLDVPSSPSLPPPLFLLFLFSSLPPAPPPLSPCPPPPSPPPPRPQKQHHRSLLFPFLFKVGLVGRSPS